MTKAMHKIASQPPQKVIAQTATAPNTIGRAAATVRHAIMLLGLISIGIVITLFIKPEMAGKLQKLSPFGTAAASTATDEEMPPLANLMGEAPAAEQQAIAADAAETSSSNVAASSNMIGTNLQQQRVTDWISKRYRVASDATNVLVSAAYLTAQETDLDPLLILAVMAIESRFNPFADSPVGAQGLMQVMSKVHHDKFADMGGAQAALNPVANIRVGAQILKEYVTRGGSVEAGLKRYVGAGNMASDDGYGAKVLGEYDRLKAIANGKQISVYAAMTSRSSSPKQQAIPNAKQNQKTEMVSTGGSVEDMGKTEKLSDNLTSL